MRQNSFKALNHIKQLNTFKRAVIKGQAPISSEELKEGLKSCGIPSCDHFITEFINSELITKIKGNLYVWNDVRPIHHALLQDIYIRYQKKRNTYMKNYMKTYRNRKDDKKEIEQAINLLKKNGYIILSTQENLLRIIQRHILKEGSIITIHFIYKF